MGPVHGLDPERQAAELHRKRVEVHGVDVAFHHVAGKHRLQAQLEALVVRRVGDQLVAEAGVDDGFGAFAPRLRGFGLPWSTVARIVGPEAEQPHEGALTVGLDATVMLERGMERIGEEPKRGEGEGPGPARGIAYGEREDLLGTLRGPARGRRVPVRRAVDAGRMRFRSEVLGVWVPCFVRGSVHGFVEGGGDLTRKSGEPRPVQQQTTVAEPLPTG